MEDAINISRLKLRAYLIPVISIIVNGVILFLSAGSFLFWEAWVYLAGSFVLMIFITAYFLNKDPELMSRRIQTREKDPSQKTVTLRILSPLLYIANYLIPGLDYRYHWSVIPAWLIIASSVIVFLGFMSSFFVFKENSYAASIIQVEKEQKVITTGPYIVVRHPMYAGMFIIFLFTPVALGSYWALIPSLINVLLLMNRTINEEKVLMRDLPGYKEYCLKTRYRLIPLIW